jgi:hypothetical protein
VYNDGAIAREAVECQRDAAVSVAGAAAEVD